MSRVNLLQLHINKHNISSEAVTMVFPLKPAILVIIIESTCNRFSTLILSNHTEDTLLLIF